MNNDKKAEEAKGKELTAEELKELRDGQVLYEMTRSEGWAVIERWLKERAFHSWIDPRECADQKEFLWRELNLFHNADVARQLLDDITRAISRSEYLGKVQAGEIKTGRMKI